jgi:hypothetical protein
MKRDRLTGSQRMRHLRECLGYENPTLFARMLEISPARWMDAERRDTPLPLRLGRRLKEKIPGITLDYIWDGELWTIRNETLKQQLK